MLPKDQEIRIVRAQDIGFRYTLIRPRSVVGWTVQFTVIKALTGESVISKTATLTDTGRGVFTVSVAKADTSSLTLSEDLPEGEEYRWDLKRTDSGHNLVMARGPLVLEREATP